MRDNKKYKILGLGLLLIIMSISIPSSVISLVNNSENSYQNLIFDTGVIKYIPLEGSFFGIISDDWFLIGGINGDLIMFSALTGFSLWVLIILAGAQLIITGLIFYKYILKNRMQAPREDNN